MRIALFGGSFDPVHAGHLKLAEAAFSELNLDKLIFVPSRRNPLKKSAPDFSGSQRLQALRRALGRDRRFAVSTLELRPGSSPYTIDTVRFFRKKFGKSATLYFLAGADTASTLRRWKDLDTLTQLCRFVVCSRPGYRTGRLPKGVSFMAFDALPVSATAIRAGLKKKERPRSTLKQR